MSLYTKKTVVYGVLEGTPGTDQVPTAAANAVEAYNVALDVVGDMKERAFGDTDRSHEANIRGKTMVDLSFDVELKGSGTAAQEPNWGPLLEACDRTLVTNAGTNCIYTPSTTIKTASIHVNIDGIQYKVAGCAGECEIDLISGEIPMLKFAFKGVYALPTDTACSAPTFDSTTAQIVKGTTTTFGNYAAIIESLNLKFGNSIVERPDFNQTEGILSYIVGDRKPTGTMVCEAVLRATTNADFMLYFNGNTSKALSMVLGATAGNIVTITAPVCKLSSPKWGDRDGIRTFEIPFQMARSVGNDEMTITLT